MSDQLLPQARLEVLDGPLAGHSVVVQAAAVTIGRNSDNSVAFPLDPLVSRTHAKVFRRGNSFYLVDIDSSNGTLLNGTSVVEPAQLHGGDTIKVGSQHLRFVVVSGATGDQLVEPTADGPQSDRSPNATPRRCIECGGNQVLSLQAAASAGTYSTVGGSLTVGGAHVLGGGPNIVGGGVGVSKQVTVSELAKMLAFPIAQPKPTAYLDQVAGCLGCLAYLVTSLFLWMGLYKTDLAWVAFVAPFVPFLLVTAVVQALNSGRNRIAKAAHDRKEADIQQDYAAKKAVYDRSLYCPQCFLVFDPETGKHASPEHLATIL